MTDLASQPDQLATDEALEDALEAFLAGTSEELEQAPEDEHAADRLLGALAGVQRRRARATALASRRIEQIREWLAEQEAPLVESEAHLTALLDGWARGQYERTGRKTIKLTSGQLTLRPLRQRTVVADHVGTDLLIAQVRNIVPEAVHTKEDVHVSDIAKVGQPGELLPDWPAEPGYVARQVVVPGAGDSGFSVVPGVAFLVPVEGVHGQRFAFKVGS